MKLRNYILVAGAILASVPAHAQHWRTLDASRQVGDSGPLSVHLTYGAGRLDVRQGTGAMLYQMHLRYDAERSEPVAHFDSATRAFMLGVRSHAGRMPTDDKDSGSLRASLSPRVPMELLLDLGAVEGEMHLGGLRLTDLSIRAGAADLTASFDEPNQEHLHTMSLDVGAAQLTIRRGGNSGVERIRANVGAGSLDLDLSGALQHDVTVSANVAVGSLTLRVPNEVGVSVDASTLLVGFETEGLVKRGDAWYTPGFEQAARHVTVRLRAFAGSFALTRNAP